MEPVCFLPDDATMVVNGLGLSRLPQSWDFHVEEGLTQLRLNWVTSIAGSPHSVSDQSLIIHRADIFPFHALDNDDVVTLLTEDSVFCLKAKLAELTEGLTEYQEREIEHLDTIFHLKKNENKVRELDEKLTAYKKTASSLEAEVKDLETLLNSERKENVKEKKCTSCTDTKFAIQNTEGHIRSLGEAVCASAITNGHLQHDIRDLQHHLKIFSRLTMKTKPEWTAWCDGEDGLALKLRISKLELFVPKFIWALNDSDISTGTMNVRIYQILGVTNKNRVMKKVFLYEEHYSSEDIIQTIEDGCKERLDVRPIILSVPLNKHERRILDPNTQLLKLPTQTDLTVPDGEHVDICIEMF